jgi:nicotinate-nucleotide adenylyltransferase
MIRTRAGTRRALFGGSFDPVHLGHLMVAEIVCELEAVDQIVFVPAWRSPHKRGTQASPEQRVHMLRLAVRGNPRLRVSAAEIRRGGASYTIDTVRHFRAAWGERPRLILGGDALLDLPTWKEAEALQREAKLVVYARPGYESARQRAAELGLRYLDATLSWISSSRLRDWLRRGRSTRYQIPDRVRRYIDAHGVYAAGRRP